MGLRGGTGRPGLGALVGLCCALLALGPAIKPGYLLFYDMVFVPHLDLNERTLGTDGSVPRAVPGDLVVALLSQLAPGWVVQKTLLVLVFVGSAAGAAGFFRSRVGAVAAAVAAAWNPYVGERLAIGHWSFLLGYACLPFLLRAAIDHRRDEPSGRSRLLLWTFLTALTGSTGAVVGLLVMLAALFTPAGLDTFAQRARRAVIPIVFFVVANSAWWFPFLFLAPRDAADPAGVSAFMSRSDTPLGTLLSLVTGGGIWNRGVWFADRASLLVAIAATAAVVGCVVVTVRTIGAGDVRSLHVRAALVSGVVGLVTAGASALPGGRSLVAWVVTTVPGGGLLRDSQKFVAPWMLFVALASGVTAQWLMTRVASAGATRLARATAAVVMVVWPVATFPGLAFGAGGRWAAVDYPQTFESMSERINRLPQGRLAVLPWNLYRRYAWNGHVVTLDPWQRLVEREVVVNDDLPLSGKTVRGESPDSALVGAAIRDRRPLAAVLAQVKVRWVLAQTDQPRIPNADLTGLRLVASVDNLRLYEVPNAVSEAGQGRSGTRFLGLTGLVLAGTLVLVDVGRTSRRRMVTRE